MLCCIENSVDPDQLALKQPADQDPHCFPLRSGFIFFKSLSSLCIFCSLGQVKFSLDKYIMAIYLSQGKYKILLFPHP